MNTITNQQFNEIINEYKDSMCVICAGNGILRNQECAAFVSISENEAKVFFDSIINDLPDNMKQFSTCKISNLTDIYDLRGFFNGNFKYINVINYGIIEKDTLIKKNMENVEYIMKRLEGFNDNEKIYTICKKEGGAFSPTEKFTQCLFSNILEAEQFVQQYNKQLGLYSAWFELSEIIYGKINDLLDCLFDGRKCSGWDIVEATYRKFNNECLSNEDIKNIIDNNKLYVLMSTDGYVMRQCDDAIFFTSEEKIANFKEINKSNMTHDYEAFLITNMSLYNDLTSNSRYVYIDGEKHCTTNDFLIGAGVAKKQKEEKRLDKENCEEEYKLGEKYFFEKDYENAYNIFMELANKNVSCSDNAKYRLGLMHYHGYFVEKNSKLAFKYFIESGQLESMVYIGTMYYWGDGVEKDYEKAFEYLSIADEEAQDGYAYFLISKMYAYGQYVRRDLDKAKYRLTKFLEINKNNKEAKHVLEMIKYHEDGTNPSDGIYY